MHIQNKNESKQDCCVEEYIDDEIFIEWKKQLERTLPTFWESIHESENHYFKRDEQIFIKSLDTLISKKTETIKNWIPYHDDGYLKFNFLK